MAEPYAGGDPQLPEEKPEEQIAKEDKLVESEAAPDADKPFKDKPGNNIAPHSTCTYLCKFSCAIILFCLGSQIAFEFTGCVLIPCLERMR